MNATDNIIMPTTCANCGKGEEESVALKNCVACKLVKYCSRDCQKAHRSQHKKECRKRAAELHDEKLFKQPPRKEDCPICFLQLPSLGIGNRYQTCCGKVICSGCIHAGVMMGDDKLCPFCRTPAPNTDEVYKKKVMERVEVGDVHAMDQLGCWYAEGMRGLPQDRDKALDLWRRAGELGYTKAYYSIGNAYLQGLGVERDEKKAVHYWELAAIGGDAASRHNLGNAEGCAGNIDRALKHFMIAVRDGSDSSLKAIKQLFMDGHATKDDYAKALGVYQAYLDEIRSVQRDEAAAFNDRYKYY